MKINEKLGLCLMDQNYFISLLFTLLVTRRAGGLNAPLCGMKHLIF
jgi:hypothetical protein